MTSKPRDLSIGAFSDDVLRRVLSAFVVDDFTVLPFFSLNGTIIDLHRRTETARKVFLEADGAVFFLKELPWYCSSVTFARFTTRFQAHLTASGMCVPRLRDADDGQSFLFDGITGSIFVLQEHLAGDSWLATVEHASAAGSALAELHRSSSTFDVADAEHRDGVYTSSRHLIELLHDFALSVDGAAARSDVERLAVESLQVVDACRDSALAAGYEANVLAVHGDYNPFNLLFDGDRVCGIVDFDNACVDNPVHDLAEAIIRFGWMRFRGLSSAYGAVPDAFDAQAVWAVIDAYREANEEAAVAAAPFLIGAAAAVALELGALGVIAGYYGLDDVATLRRNASCIRDLLQDVLDPPGSA